MNWLQNINWLHISVPLLLCMYLLNIASLNKLEKRIRRLERHHMRAEPKE